MMKNAWGYFLCYILKKLRRNEQHVIDRTSE